MADSLLATLLDTQYKARENPFGLAAQSLASNAGSLVNPYGSVGSNAAASIGAALLAGLLGGVARSQTQSDNAELSPLLNQMMTATPEQRQALVQQNDRLSPLANALAVAERQQQAEIAQERQKLALTRESKFQEIPIKVAEENALLDNYAKKQEIKGKYDPSATHVNVGMPGQMPAAVAGEVYEGKALVDMAGKLANDLGAYKGGTVKDYIRLQGAKVFPGLDENQIGQRLANLADKVMRSRTGAAAPPAESAALKKIIAGDWTASGATVQKLLRSFAAEEAQSVLSKAELGKQLAQGDTSQLEADLNRAIAAAAVPQAQPVPNVVTGPDGNAYVFTD